jgi:inner membrane protein
MATIYTHAVVGLGMGKLGFSRPLPAVFWLLAGFLPIVPDFDVFSSARYGAIYGHRGFTHSLLFALMVSILASAATHRFLKLEFGSLLAFFFLIVASHGLLDACTDGGEGIPFFWPIYDRRFGPWGPIHVSDLGFELPDPRTSRAIRTELLWVWLPTALLVGAVTGFRRLGAARRGKGIDASA